MAENTAISWADHTFNPWEGCRAVSPGCAHCYAKTLVERFGKNFGVRRRTSEANWKKPLKWNKKASAVLREQRDDTKWGIGPKYLTNPRVFCPSMADWLDDEVPIEWLADLLDLIRITPNLDWLLLTKRPENWENRLARAWMLESNREPKGVFTKQDWINNWYGRRIGPPNVWIGVTVEDQQRADERLPALLSIPAKVRFLSCEPLLEEVRIFAPLNMRPKDQSLSMMGGIHWVITGGESGPGFRPFNPEWARSLRDQCKAASVAFHMKQMGGLRPSTMPPIPDDLMIREFPTT